MEGQPWQKLTSMHFMHGSQDSNRNVYLRTKSAVDAIKFTLDNAKEAKTAQADQSSNPTEPVASTSDLIAEADDKSQNNPATVVEPLTPAELKQMLEKSKKARMMIV